MLRSMILMAAFLAVAPLPVRADVDEQLQALAQEVRQLTGQNADGDDTRKFERYVAIALQQALRNSPEWATQQGEAYGQDRWSDLSFAAIERQHQEDRDGLALLQSIDRERLDAANQLNYDLMLDGLQNSVDGQAFPQELLPMNQMGGPQQDAANMLAMMPAQRPQQMENQLARLAALPQLIDQSIALMRKGLATGVTPPAITLRNVPQQIRNQLVDDPGHSPLLGAFVEPAAALDSLQAEALRQRAFTLFREQVVPAYERLLAFTETEYLPGARASIAAADLPNGAAWYAYNVKSLTTTGLSPEQIHAMGLAEVSRIRAEMDRVIDESGFDGDFAAFLQFLRTDPQFYHVTAQDLMREYRDIAKRADPELAHLFGVLPRNPYGVIEVPSFAAASQTTAYYQSGSVAAGRPGYFYANTYALETRPRWEMEALTLHEAVPGHHLQIAIQQELENVPWFRQDPSYTAFVEGWGLYAESLGEEMGFYRDPYSKFGQLTYEMWRAIRLVVDTGMHHLGWSRQQAIDYFMSNAGKQEHDIIVEIDRYIVWPGQALAYKIGELKIKELRAWAQQTLGDRFDIRAFHDAVLGQGAIPLHLLEANIHAWVAAQQG